MNYVDYKYIMLLSSRLERFKNLGNNVFNFRCPFCGDSKKKKTKARGYIFEIESNAIFKCHNCGKSGNFSSILAELDHGLYTQYKLEKFGTEKKSVKKEKYDVSEKIKGEVKFDRSPLKKCFRLDSLPDDLKVVLDYAKKRKIPEKFFSKLYAAYSLNDISKNIEKYIKKEFPNFPVLVIPFFKKDGSFDYIQCRNITDSNNIRFITFEINESAPKLWGEFRVDWCRPIYVLEGPIDSMFIENSIALAGAAHSSSIEYIISQQKIHCEETDKKNIVICYDNDYRYNHEIMNQLNKRINEGFSVVLYDKKFKFKDINEAIKSGWSIEEINTYVRERTFHGLSAKLEISNLKRG